MGIETRLRMTDKDWDRTNNILLGTSHEAPRHCDIDKSQPSICGSYLLGSWVDEISCCFMKGFAVWMTGQSEVTLW